MLVALALSAHAVHVPQPNAGSSGRTHCAPQRLSPALQRKSHTPAPHVGAALAGELHALPHARQWLTELLRSASQPLPRLTSQSAKPALQLKPHSPPAHTGVALAPPPQRAAQRPQCSVERFKSTSQPLRGSPSQSPKPGSQLIRQPPEVHIGVERGPEVHTVPHAPQLLLVLRLVSHPSRSSPLQFAVAAVQTSGGRAASTPVSATSAAVITPVSGSTEASVVAAAPSFASASIAASSTGAPPSIAPSARSASRCATAPSGRDASSSSSMGCPQAASEKTVAERKNRFVNCITNVLRVCGRECGARALNERRSSPRGPLIHGGVVGVARGERFFLRRGQRVARGGSSVLRGGRERVTWPPLFLSAPRRSPRCCARHARRPCSSAI
jgi:hypothetical protein